MKKLLFTIAVLAALLSAPLTAQDLEVELQRAIQKETVSGDLKAAIAEYRRIADRAGKNRVIAAQALVRMAGAHRKLGDAEARSIYERIVKDYADQREPATEARARLASFRPDVPVSAGQATRQVWVGDGADALGAPSADGRVLSFTDWTTGDLAVRDLATGTNRRLTNTGGWEKSGDYAEYSVPSPDGRTVAYAWFTDKPAAGAAYYDLRVTSLANGDAGKSRVLYRSDDIKWVAPCGWTPDGKNLVIMREFKGQPFELAVIALSTGAIRTLKVTGSPSQRVSVSPDGRYVAYDRRSAANRASRDIFVVAMDGTGETPVASTAANEEMPLWSADGSTVLFLSNRTGRNALWSVGVKGGKPVGSHQLIKSDVGAFHPLGLTRDGGLYYWVGGNRVNVFLSALDADMKTTGEPSLVAEHFLNSNTSGVWSADGHSIAYYSFRGPRGSDGTSLVIRDGKTGQERDIPLTVPVSRNWTGPKWFPDGRAVLVLSRDQEVTSCYRVDVSTGTESMLMKMKGSGFTLNSPTISADGKSLFYLDSNETDKSRNLTMAELESGRERVVVKGWIHSVAISPDGQHLVYLGSRDSSTARTNEIAVVPVSGGEPRVLYTATWLDGTRFNALSWTPDGRNILFVRPGDTPGTDILWRVPAAGGEAQKVGITVQGQLRYPNLHPDGRRLLFSTRDQSESAVWVLENFLPPVTPKK